MLLRTMWSRVALAKPLSVSNAFWENREEISWGMAAKNTGLYRESWWNNSMERSGSRPGCDISVEEEVSYVSDWPCIILSISTPTRSRATFVTRAAWEYA